MNRADLWWALSSVLPHVGSHQTASVGLVITDGEGFAFATDNYTAGIARFTLDLDDAFLPFHLPTGEAKDLARWVKPRLKAHHDEPVTVLLSPGGSGGTSEALNGPELHVAIPGDSAVYETTDSELTLEGLLQLLRAVAGTPVEHGDAIYNPDLFERFGKAQREPADRLRLYPHRTNERYGVGLVTVGNDFLGGITGLEYDDAGAEILTGFLQNADSDIEEAA